MVNVHQLLILTGTKLSASTTILQGPDELDLVVFKGPFNGYCEVFVVSPKSCRKRKGRKRLATSKPLNF